MDIRTKSEQMGLLFGRQFGTVKEGFLRTLPLFYCAKISREKYIGFLFIKRVTRKTYVFRESVTEVVYYDSCDPHYLNREPSVEEYLLGKCQGRSKRNEIIENIHAS
jgi:hypothetical protein